MALWGTEAELKHILHGQGFLNLGSGLNPTTYPKFSQISLQPSLCSTVYYKIQTRKHYHKVTLRLRSFSQVIVSGHEHYLHGGEPGWGVVSLGEVVEVEEVR